MTLESWSMGIVRPVTAVYPWAWAFFVPFILVTTFAVVNLVVGLVVKSMREAHAEEAVARRTSTARRCSRGSPRSRRGPTRRVRGRNRSYLKRGTVRALIRDQVHNCNTYCGCTSPDRDEA
jgi:hypothetical protein